MKNMKNIIIIIIWLFYANNIICQSQNIRLYSNGIELEVEFEIREDSVIIKPNLINSQKKEIFFGKSGLQGRYFVIQDLGYFSVGLMNYSLLHPFPLESKFELIPLNDSIKLPQLIISKDTWVEKLRISFDFLVSEEGETFVEKKEGKYYIMPKDYKKNKTHSFVIIPAVEYKAD